METRPFLHVFHGVDRIRKRILKVNTTQKISEAMMQDYKATQAAHPKWRRTSRDCGKKAIFFFIMAEYLCDRIQLCQLF